MDTVKAPNEVAGKVHQGINHYRAITGKDPNKFAYRMANQTPLTERDLMTIQKTIAAGDDIVKQLYGGQDGSDWVDGQLRKMKVARVSAKVRVNTDAS